MTPETGLPEQEQERARTRHPIPLSHSPVQDLNVYATTTPTQKKKKKKETPTRSDVVFIPDAHDSPQGERWLSGGEGRVLASGATN